MRLYEITFRRTKTANSPMDIVRVLAPSSVKAVQYTASRKFILQHPHRGPVVSLVLLAENILNAV